MQKDLNYRLPMHLKYLSSHDLLKKYFPAVFDKAIFKKSSIFEFLGISGISGINYA